MKSKRLKILIIRLGAFGDALQSAGAIRDVRLQYPDAEITMLTTKPYQKIFQRCPDIDRILIDPRAPRYNLIALLKLRNALTRERFDLIIDLQNSRRTLMYRSWLDGNWSQKDEAYNQHLAKNLGRPLSVLERAVIQLEKTGIKTKHTLTPDVNWLVDDVKTILKELEIEPGYILLLPGSSARHPQKRWPHYAELTSRLLSHGYTVVTAPGPDEIELCNALPCQAIYLHGQPVSFNILAGIIKQSALVIGNDSGPTHLAAYLGVKGIALYGSHAGAQQIGLNAFLDIIEVKNLAQLNVDRVFNHAMSILLNN